MATRKVVVIYQENNAPIQLSDEDDRSLEDYSKSLSEFMTHSNISILQTSNEVVILRPSKINSIYVNDTEILPDEVGRPKPPPPPLPKKKVNKPKKKVKVDIITDVD